MTAAAQDTAAVLDALTPFDRDDFRADLGELAEAVREDWKRWAAQAVLTARLAAQVPADDGERRVPTAWKSFVREIAVARRCSDQAAAKEVFLSIALVRSFPRVLALLQTGQLPLYNAKVLLEETAACSPDVLDAADAELADRACRLTPSRIREAVRRLELRFDGDAAAARSAAAAAHRDVRVHAQRDDQATLVLTGPALPIMQFYETVTASARAARAAGDPRSLDNLRFDIALDAPGSLPPSLPTEPDMADLVPLDLTPADLTPAGLTPADFTPADLTPPDFTRADLTPPDLAPPDLGFADVGAADAPPSSPAGGPACNGVDPTPGVAAWPVWVGDRRRLRPIQVLLHLPVTTALGLDNEPGWLPGYGWISAPQCRQWLTIAELRQVCVGRDGTVLDTADRVVRPEPTPAGVREAVLAMVRDPGDITEKTWRVEDQHDPSPALAGFIDIRDVYCDGPTGTRVPAARCDRDHELAYPEGPTAAWNLVDRARRTHLLKHRGWTPLRTRTSTLWFSPAGQVIEVPHHHEPPPEVDEDALLPDADDLHALDASYLQPVTPGDRPPWLAPRPTQRPPADLDDPPF